VDERDSLGLLTNGAYEPYETTLLLSVCRRGSIVLDIGANVGYHTVQFAQAVGPDGHVIAFEPDPDNLRLLAHNVRTNGLANVTIVAKAAAKESGARVLYLSGDNTGDHRVYDSGDARQSIEIEAVAVDELLTGLDRAVSLVKLDIQGAEPWAFEGMRSFLSEHPEAWVATELWPLGLHRSGSSTDVYLDQLRATGAAILRIDERRQRLVSLDLAWLSSTVTVERGNHTNLLLPRRDWVLR
jgi:FkbM family methyltransferase